MHAAEALRFRRVGAASDPLVELEKRLDSRQARYLRCYLHDLKARTVVIEPNYFDRDYLSEFAAFYATSSTGYPNICQRAHYFSANIGRALFAKAAGGDPRAQQHLTESYLGHIVIRPIPSAPIGRTVLRVYPDEVGIAEGTPRIMQPAREYEAHVAGLRLRVSGLAWQQQDSAVGSCSTVALWSILHSSAFDDHHAIPTTASITSLAHAIAPSGKRAFPDSGLQLAQVLEVIKGHSLAPVMIAGDEEGSEFSRQRFCTLVASFVRSGYPVLVSGWLDVPDAEREPHTVCIVGFRSPTSRTVPSGEYALADEALELVYVHDDNLGPNARFRIRDTGSSISLVPESPDPLNGRWPTQNPTTSYHEIVPSEIIVAVHHELRTDPLELQRAAITFGAWLPSALAHEIDQQHGTPAPGMVIATRFTRFHRYVEEELALSLRKHEPKVLAQARLALWERVPPMSLHVGLVRVSLGLEPMLDILFDTSDSDRHLRPAAHVSYQPQVPWLLKRWVENTGITVELGVGIRAW